MENKELLPEGSGDAAANPSCHWPQCPEFEAGVWGIPLVF